MSCTSAPSMGSGSPVVTSHAFIPEPRDAARATLVASRSPSRRPEEQPPQAVPERRAYRSPVRGVLRALPTHRLPLHGNADRQDEAHRKPDQRIALAAEFRGRKLRRIEDRQHGRVAHLVDAGLFVCLRQRDEAAVLLEKSLHRRFGVQQFTLCAGQASLDELPFAARLHAPHVHRGKVEQVEQPAVHRLGDERPRGGDPQSEIVPAPSLGVTSSRSLSWLTPFWSRSVSSRPVTLSKSINLPRIGSREAGARGTAYDVVNASRWGRARQQSD